MAAASWKLPDSWPQRPRPHGGRAHRRLNRSNAGRREEQDMHGGHHGAAASKPCTVAIDVSDLGPHSSLL